MFDVTNVSADMIQKAQAIERYKSGRALTTEESDLLKAVGFLRMIAPYLFDQEKGSVNESTQTAH